MSGSTGETQAGAMGAHGKGVDAALTPDTRAAGARPDGAAPAHSAGNPAARAEAATPDPAPAGRRAASGAMAARIPGATYRLQLRPDFGFAEAAALLPYLVRLGITDLYLSPCLQARPGTLHGYDIGDHNRLSPDLGGEEGFDRLAAALEAAGMGLTLDFVPNHMGVEEPSANPWWWDVLENGTCSPYGRFFDVDWDPVKPELRGRVLLPVLGDPYGRVLERGELRLVYAGGALELHYFDRRLPINPRRVPEVLRVGLDALGEEMGSGDPDLMEFHSVLTALDNLPSRLETDPARITERQREKAVARARLERLLERSPRMRRHVDEALAAVNGAPGDPASFDRLHALLENQAYRLAYWRTAFHEINYRRFFDINGLASVRMEDPVVFATVHALVLDLIAQRRVTGLRIDHLDGLYDPAAYLERLQVAAARGLGATDCPEAGSAPLSATRPLPLYVVAEKILSPGETLRPGWSLHGTTGYDFLGRVNGLWVDPERLPALTRIAHRFTRRRQAFADVGYESKKQVMGTTLASEVNVLAHALNRVSEADRGSRDFTLNSLRDLLVEIVACFPVYRTYVSAAGHAPEDRKVLAAAVTAARRRNRSMDGSLFEFFLDVMLDRNAKGLSDEARRLRLEFALKFQQYTGPVQAKGVEDTAFFRHLVLLSLTEVGGAPEHPCSSPEEFHAAMKAHRERWPHGMLCTATHDTKLGEDARARLDVLSEIPEEWQEQLARWAKLNDANRTRVAGAWAPDPGDQYLFYQALLAAWPPGSPEPERLAERLRGYMGKVIREAKLHTSWVQENPDYERAVEAFVTRTLTGPRTAAFLESFVPFAGRVARNGMVNSLAQLVLKLAAPGVPDLYQGTEFWDLTLVDPDNRRPVDHAARAARLEALAGLVADEADGPGRADRAAGERADDAPAARPAQVPGDRADGAARLMAGWRDGAIKLYVTARGLALRKADPELFLHGEYLPLELRGGRAAHAVAFARVHGDRALIAVVPRLTSRLAGEGLPLGEAFWGDTAVILPGDLAMREWRETLTGRAFPLGGGSARTTVPLAEVIRVCPVALLVANGGR